MTKKEAQTAFSADLLSEAFEHSITWEDDIWRADPVDVELVHAKARARFGDLLSSISQSSLGKNKSAKTQARILLFHGQSGAGKTHLIRALRTSAHREGNAFFGYAQMTPDIANYADYYLRRLIHSLEQPYCPDGNDGNRSALTLMTDRMVNDAEDLPAEGLEQLRDAALGDKALANLVLELADAIVASPTFSGQELDINVVRALLYLQRRDPRVDQRIRQYLNGQELTSLSHAGVSALDPNTGDGRAFDIITALGNLMWTIDRSALVFCIDQVEDLRFFDDAEERFQRAVRDLIQIANRLPNAIVLISCLDDFYSQVRSVLAQSYIDRIEKAGPVALLESRTPEEARLIIAKRLEHIGGATADGPNVPDPSAFFSPQFFEEFGGLSTRRLLELAQRRLSDQANPHPDALELEDAEKAGFVSTLAAALGLAAAPAESPSAPVAAIDYREIWNQFQNSSEAEMPSNDAELMDVLASALQLAREEWAPTITLDVKRVEVADDLPVLDIDIKHTSGLATDARIFLCNRRTQGGGLKRQLDKVLAAMQGKSCFMLRATDFPPNRKNLTAQSFRKYRDGGGRSLLVPIPDWERMMMVREFHAHHKNDPGFTAWFESAKLLSNVTTIIQLLRLDLLGRSLPLPANGFIKRAKAADPAIQDTRSSGQNATATEDGERAATGSSAPWSTFDATEPGAEQPTAANDDELPISVILDENGENGKSIVAGRDIGGQGRPISLNTSVLKRHTAVLGGSGSGKTTLALTLIEQFLLRGIPAILIDRKGDLCSYANPDVWRSQDNEVPGRQSEREKLADAIDVAVYTPGRATGRPISITLLPTGINELPEHEQQLLANLSSAALGDMLHIKKSATHQKQSGTLAVALKILGGRFSTEVTLGDLIELLEEEDAELTDLTQRMDPSGRIRRDLVAQLDSLRHRNSALFEGGGEQMRMEALLGLGQFARPGRTRLSVIYTGFLGDNENILFWVAQFLSEALRFCQRNPNDELQAVVMFDEADLYIPANARPATAEPLQSLLKRARSAGLGLMLATQSPGDLDYKSRDQITSWFIGRVREDTALRKLKAAFQSESGLEPAKVLPSQTVGEFHLVQEGLVRAMKAQRSLITAEQVAFDRIEQLARETLGQDEHQLKLFDTK